MAGRRPCYRGGAGTMGGTDFPAARNHDQAAAAAFIRRDAISRA